MIKKIIKKLNKDTEIVKDDMPNLPDVRTIEVPDLKQYLVNGYEEIRAVRKVNEELEEELEEAQKNKILYESTLVTLDEFKKRDDENNKQINKLKKEIKSKEDEIYKLHDLINTYKIRERELKVKEKNLDNEIQKELEVKVNEILNNIVNKIKETKGNIGKSQVCKEILKEKI